MEYILQVTAEKLSFAIDNFGDPWLAVYTGETTAVLSPTPRASSPLFQPGYYVGNVGIECVKPTHISFPLCCSLPAVSSNSYIYICNSH